MNSATRNPAQANLGRHAKSRLILGAEVASIAAAFLFVGVMVFML